MSVVDQIKSLSQQLTPQQRVELAAYFGKLQNGHAKEKPISLRGIWKDKFPNDADVSKMISQVRNEWNDEIELLN